MSNRYLPDQKAAVMALLERNRGNIQLTAQQTGIPDRTLYDWQGDILPYMQQYAPPTPPASETPVFEDDLDALAFIRQNIIAELSRLSASLKDDPGFRTPYERALVVSQLIDKIVKLDVHLKPFEEKELVVRVVREDRGMDTVPLFDSPPGTDLRDGEAGFSHEIGGWSLDSVLTTQPDDDKQGRV